MKSSFSFFLCLSVSLHEFDSLLMVKKKKKRIQNK
jgi:hypothetical protein